MNTQNENKKNGFFMGIYKHSDIFPDDSVEIILKNVMKYCPVFFPALIYTDQNEYKTIHKPADFSIEDVPDAYWIVKDEDVHIPLHGKHDLELIICDTQSPDLIPCSIQFTWPNMDYLADFRVLEHFLTDLSELLAADYGVVSDKQLFHSDKYYDRSFEIDRISEPLTVYWINWFGKPQIETIGTDILSEANTPITSRPTANGHLLTLQRAPFDYSNPGHRAAQERLARELGLQ